MASRREAERAENRFFRQFDKGPVRRPKANVPPRKRSPKGAKNKATGTGGQ